MKSFVEKYIEPVTLVLLSLSAYFIFMFVLQFDGVYFISELRISDCCILQLVSLLMILSWFFLKDTVFWSLLRACHHVLFFAFFINIFSFLLSRPYFPCTDLTLDTVETVSVSTCVSNEDTLIEVPEDTSEPYSSLLSMLPVSDNLKNATFVKATLNDGTLKNQSMLIHYLPYSNVDEVLGAVGFRVSTEPNTVYLLFDQELNCSEDDLCTDVLRFLNYSDILEHYSTPLKYWIAYILTFILVYLLFLVSIIYMRVSYVEA